ncbi:MAG: hypothetical protein WDM77_16750 [Steroidobacteraceae bacterium]
MRWALKMALATATFSVLSWANPLRAADNPKPLFASDDVLSLTLTGPIDTISRAAAAEPVAAVLKVGGATPETLPVTLSVRGVTRRREDICTFPPLRVEFTQKTRTVFPLQGTEAPEARDPLPAHGRIPAICAAGI